MSWLLRDSLVIKKDEYIEIKKQAFVDSLTGFYNRNFLETYKTSIFLDSVSKQTSLITIFLDLNGFKAVNDNYGHLIGDEVLVVVTKCIRRSTRGKTDYLIRYGGDEFVAFFQACNFAEIKKIATRVKKLIAQICVWQSTSAKISQIPTTLVIDFGVPIKLQLGLLNMLNCFDLAAVTDDKVYEFLHKHGTFFQITTSLGVSYMNESDECMDDVLARAELLKEV